MTTKELLVPRIKIIADWPDMPMNRAIGDILPCSIVGVIQITKSNHCQYSSFPHLFKKLEWWQDRSIEDMPMFVKTANGYIRKVLTHFVGSKKEWIDVVDESGRTLRKTYLHCDPSTEAEYNQFKANNP